MGEKWGWRWARDKGGPLLEYHFGSLGLGQKFSVIVSSNSCFSRVGLGLGREEVTGPGELIPGWGFIWGAGEQSALVPQPGL